MAVGAHPSDVEFHGGATLARFAREGARVVVFVCTDDACEVACAPDGAAARRREAARAADVLGADEIIWADAPPTADRREAVLRQLVREIRRNRVERVLVHDPTTWWRSASGITRLGRADHRDAGRAGIEAAHPRAPLPQFYPELVGEGIDPWIVREVWLFESGAPDHFVDVTATWDLKLAALACHVSQLPTRLAEEASTAAARHGGDGGRVSEGFRRLCLL